MMNAILLTLHSYEEPDSYRDEEKVRNISLCSFSFCLCNNGGCSHIFEKLDVEIRGEVIREQSTL